MQIHGENDNFFGKIVIFNELASQEEVKECLRLQEALRKFGYNMPLGEILAEKGLINRETVHDILDLQRRRLHQSKLAPAEDQVEKFQVPEGTAPGKAVQFGQMVISNKLLPLEKLDECLAIQQLLRKHGIRKKIGEIVVSKGYLTKTTVDSLLAAQHAHRSNRILYLQLAVAFLALASLAAMVLITHWPRKNQDSHTGKPRPPRDTTPSLLTRPGSTSSPVTETGTPPAATGTVPPAADGETPAPERQPLPGEDKLFPELYEKP